jgi:hypothetical protein
VLSFTINPCRINLPQSRRRRTSLRAASIVAIACALIIAMVDSARCGPLEDLVNTKFPAITPDQQSQRAIKTALDTLRSTADVNVGVGVAFADLRTVVLARPEVQAAGMTEINLTGDNDVLDISMTLDRIVDGKIIPDSRPTLKALFDKLHPHVVGRISFGIAVESATEGATKDQVTAIVFRILPVFRNIKIDKITVDTGELGQLLGQNTADMTGAADFIVGWLNGYADRISGGLSHLEFTRISVPLSPLPVESANHSFQASASSQTKIDVKVSGSSISAPARVVAIGWLIDHSHIIGVAKLAFPTDPKPSSPPQTGGAGFTDLKELVDQRLKEGLGIADWPNHTTVAVSKSLIAIILNSAFLQSHLCLTASTDIPTEEFEKKVHLPSASLIDCTPSKRCDQPHDERSCGGCIKRPFHGGCWIHTNDPVCEAAKAAQNSIYAGNKAKCEAEKETLRLACEGGKGIVDAIAHTGNFANIDGSFGAGSASLTACIQSAVFAPKLDSADLLLLLGGQGNADTHIHFTPLDIVGHLACQAPWSQSKRVSISLPNQNLNVTAEAHHTKPEDDSLGYDLKMRTSGLVVQMRPAPRDIILSSYNMDVACAPIAPLVNTVGFSAAPFIPELRGEVRIPDQELSLHYDVRPVQVKAGQTPITLRFSDNGTALIGTAEIAQ